MKHLIVNIKLHITLFLLALLTLTTISNANAQIHFCIIYTDSGNPLVSWQYKGSGVVTQYIIRWGDSPNNFAYSQNIEPTAAWHRITNINSSFQPVYIKLIYSTQNSTDSVIFSTIHLSAHNTNDVGISNLNIKLYKYMPSGILDIERFENSRFEPLNSIAFTSGSTDNISYNDTITYPFCSESSIMYRAFYSSDNVIENCGYPSNHAFISIGKDITSPRNVTNDYVTVVGSNNNSNIKISWQAPPDPDVDEYLIERKSANTNFLNIGSVKHPICTFIDSTANACDSIYTYAIVSVDKCGNKSYGTYMHERSNIVLDVVEPNICDNSVSMSWNAYNASPKNVVEYSVLRKSGDNDFETIANLSSTTTNYIDSHNLTKNGIYTYKIKAKLSNGVEVESCAVSVIYTGVELPDLVYINNATVDGNQVVVTFSHSPENTAKKAYLQRSTTQNGQYTTVNTIDFSPNYIPQFTSIIDSTAEVNSISYFYKISVPDSCDNNTVESYNTGRNILLYITSNSAYDNIVNLNWSKYIEWDSRIAKHMIIRINDNNEYDTIAEVGPDVFYYEDNISAQSPTANNCYKVIAFEDRNLNDSVIIYSESNISCAVKETILSIPNAFKPSGINRLFKPVINNISIEKYSMQIFNKWGSMIFETDNYVMGWDGETKDGPAPSDVYIYLINFTDTKGIKYQEKGTVMLVR
ncbi:MAG: gliding motility-associated C-terminal domain-containing protein [Lentimicrobiaceae bacterium]|nr:gliding motility-associated C-terminal domain-containing protein [Lentimicrobiaceae bacterium]